MDGDLNPVTNPGQHFVNRIVHYLVHEMVQRFDIGAANVHPGPATNRLQSLQHLNIRRLVAVNLTYRLLFSSCHFSSTRNRQPLTADC